MLKFFLLLLLTFEVNCYKKKTLTKLYGGKKESIEKAPYFVSLYTPRKCGGVILSKDWILTAAHCLIFNGNYQEWIIVVGSDHPENAGGENGENLFEVVQVIKHDLMDFSMTRSRTNDIALIKLTKPLVFNNKIKPVKIRTTPLQKEMVKVIGMGIINNNKDHAELRSIFVPTINKETCMENFNSHYGTKFTMPEDLFCASLPDKLPCLGDSGGPVVDLNGELVGIISSGDAHVVCAEGSMLSAYTSIYYHLDWIKKHTKITFDSYFVDEDDYSDNFV